MDQEKTFDRVLGLLEVYNIKNSWVYEDKSEIRKRLEFLYEKATMEEMIFSEMVFQYCVENDIRGHDGIREAINTLSKNFSMDFRMEHHMELVIELLSKRVKELESELRKKKKEIKELKAKIERLQEH